jgi:hypothetical protein
MQTKRKLISYIIYSTVCILILLFIYFLFIGYKTGQGKHVLSPDGNFNAFVMLYEQHRILRNDKFYTVTWIENKEKKILWTATFKDRYSYFYWYDRGNVEWSDDGSRVVFTYINQNNNKEILFRVVSPSLNTLSSPR